MSIPPSPPHDRGPTRPSSPGPGDEGWWNLFGDPVRQAPPVKNRKPLIVTGVAAAALVVAGLVGWLALRPGDDETGQAQNSTPAATPKAETARQADPAEETRLLGMLPAGFVSQSCQSAPAPPGVTARVTCTQPVESGGPTTLTMTLADDVATLTGQFDRVVGESGTVLCPGNIQSPGPWRRNATPDLVSGTVVCGVRSDRQTVAWTDERRLLLVQAESAAGGAGLDALYAWWSTHS